MALVYAGVSGQYFGDVQRLASGPRHQRRHPRAAAGERGCGPRPDRHAAGRAHFGSFLVERAFEQVKLGFNHQDIGGVLVGAVAPTTSPAGAGRTRCPATSP